MQPTARGRIFCWEGGSLWIGETGGSAQFHEHHALQISLAFSGTIRFKTRQHDWRAFAAGLVPPHLSHAFEGAAQFAAQIFVEPETLEGRALLARFGRDAIAELPVDEVALHATALRTVELREAHATALQRAARQFVDGLAGAQRPAVVDARIERTIRSLWQSDRTVTLGEAAARVALSPGRFRHLFVEQTGQSFRSYQLWTRLQRAIEVMSSGAAATEAAHTAGFSDAAHLTRTFRKMMGIAPTSVKID
jgi:AraC family transcriptional regulator